MAGKRTVPPSFADLNERKRLRAASAASSIRRPRTTSSTSFRSSALSDELFLLIFSYLDFASLAAIERVDRHFMRLANDSSLWKSLYLGLDLHASTAPLAMRSIPHRYGASTSSSGRPMAPLPARTSSAENQQGTVDWKFLYRVRTNFSNGRSTLTSLPGTPSPSLPAVKAVASSVILPETAVASPSPQRSTLLALCSPFLVTMSTAPSSSTPSGSIFLAKVGAEAVLRAGDEVLSFTSPGLETERQRGSSKGDVRPTDMALSSSGWTLPNSRSGRRTVDLYVAYSSGAWSIFALSFTSTTSAPQVVERHFQPAPASPPLNEPIVSALHGSLLVTCTDHFRLTFYHLPAGRTKGAIRPFRSLRSLTSWMPASLILAPYYGSKARDGMMKLSIAYAVPCYPDLFSAALQEIVLAPPSPDAAPRRWDWVSDRSLSALATSSSSFLAADATPEQVGTVNRVTAITADERWVCLAGADNVVQCFEIPQEGANGAVGKLEWRQTLWAHSAGVTSVSMLDGRCVTADSTGRILIWELDRDLPPHPVPLTSPPPPDDRVLSPSPPQTPRAARAPVTNVGWVEVLTPRRAPGPTSAAAADGEERWEDAHARETGRGRERIEYVVQDGERIVSAGVPRDGAGESRVKVWSFDC